MSVPKDSGFSGERAFALIDQARAKGASAADLLFYEGDAFSAVVRLGEIDKLSNARGKSLGLRVFSGRRSAVVSTSDLSEESLERLAADACALSKAAADDEACALPDPGLHPREILDLDLDDPQERDIEGRIDLARRAERAALESDPRITNSEGGEFENNRGLLLYASSNGFLGSFRSATASLAVVPVASENGRMQRDYWYSSRRKLSQIESPESIGRTAAFRTLRRLGAKKVATRRCPVVFDPESAATLLSHLASALSGYSLYRRASFLYDKLGERIGSELLNVIDDGTLAGGLGSSPFDGEGLPTGRSTVIERGVLKSYLLDTYSARKLGLESTGNASRGTQGPPGVAPHNFYFQPGTKSPEEIIRSVPSGLYVTDLIGFGVNLVTGDYSRGAAGLWIENGELAYPVEEITIAGNLLEMLNGVGMVGNDLNLNRRIASPTIKIFEMTLAGE